MTWALALVLGLVVGCVMGALGGGGAVLTVPLLVYLLGVPPLLATTMSLVVVGVSSLVSASSAGRARLVDGRMAAAFVVLGLLGSAVGTRLAHGVDGDALMRAFGALLLVIAAIMWRRSARPPGGAGGGSSGAAAATLEPAPGGRGARWWVRVALAATGVSLLTGFFGVGGGFAIVPALTLLLGTPMRTAVGTSLLVIAGNCLTALVWRLDALDGLDWPLTLALTGVMVVGGLAGGRLGRRAPAHVLQRSFAVLLVLVGCWTLLESLLA